MMRSLRPGNRRMLHAPRASTARDSWTKSAKGPDIRWHCDCAEDDEGEEPELARREVMVAVEAYPTREPCKRCCPAIKSSLHEGCP